MAAALITTKRVNEVCRMLKEAGCRIERDDEAGTVRAFDGTLRAFLAIQKGRGQPWIAAFINTDNITWETHGRDKTAETDRGLGSQSRPDREDPPTPGE